MSSRVNNAEAGAGDVKGRALAEVERDIAWCTDELQTLRAEHDSLPALVEAATAALDFTRKEELERRGRELSKQIDEAQARFCRLQAERAGLLLPEAEAEAAALKAAYDRAHAEYLEAYTRTNRLGVEYDNAQAQAHRLRQSIEENARRSRELSGQAARQV
jgi:chromosome segregation ATPase